MRPFLCSKSRLFRKRQSPFHVEPAVHTSCSGARLAAADEDFVGPLGDNRFARFIDHAHVAGLEFKVDFLRPAGIEVHALESSQGLERRTSNLGELKIELGYFVAFRLPGVGDRNIDSCRAAGSYRAARSIPMRQKRRV